MARFTSPGGSGSGAPGPQGPRGPEGDSAYDVAVANGFVGTEQEWLDSFGGTGADIADFIFTAEEGQSVISLPNDRQMRIQGGEDSDLYLTSGDDVYIQANDDLYLQTLGQGDDIHINAADDIRFSAGNENAEFGGAKFWRMDSEGRFQLPGNGYIENPQNITYDQGNRVDTFTNNYLNDSSGLNNTSSVALPVDQTTMWYVNNQNSFNSPATITFQDSTTVTAVAIYDATSQGIPAVIFQWNTGDLTKTFEETFPLNIAVAYAIVIPYGQDTIVLDPASNESDQKIVIDPTSPNHIHIRAGGEIDNSSADLFLGGEETHVRLSDQSGSVEILGADITISSYASPSSLNINTYSGAVINSARTSTYDPEDKVVATLGDIEIGIANAEPVETSFTVNGGTLGTQPTFNGSPLFSGTYVKTGPMVHFQIQVDMDNILTFGDGQYYVDLPFPAKYGYQVKQGCLHDDSSGKQYAIGGHVFAGQSRLALTFTNSAGQDEAFDFNSPVTLNVADNFHIAGTYITS